MKNGVITLTRFNCGSKGVTSNHRHMKDKYEKDEEYKIQKEKDEIARRRDKERFRDEIAEAFAKVSSDVDEGEED